MIYKSKEYIFFKDLLEVCCGSSGLLYQLRVYQKKHTYSWSKISSKKNEEILVKTALYILTESLVDIMNSIDTLIKNRNISGINALARIFIENYVYLNTIDDSKQRSLTAKRYVISNELNTMKKYIEILSKEERCSKYEDLFEEYNFWVFQWNKYQPSNITKKGKTLKLNWYSERNFKDLCQKKDFLGLEDYHIYQFYMLYSIEVHSLNPSAVLSNSTNEYDYSQKEMIVAVLSLINWMMFTVLKVLQKYIDFDIKQMKFPFDMQVKLYFYRKSYGISPYNSIVFDKEKNKFRRVYKK